MGMQAGGASTAIAGAVGWPRVGVVPVGFDFCRAAREAWFTGWSKVVVSRGNTLETGGSDVINFQNIITILLSPAMVVAFVLGGIVRAGPLFTLNYNRNVETTR